MILLEKKNIVLVLQAVKDFNPPMAYLKWKKSDLPTELIFYSESG